MSIHKKTTDILWTLDIDFKPKNRKRLEKRTYFLNSNTNHDRGDAETITVFDMHGKIVKDAYIKDYVEEIWRRTLW